MQTTTKTVEMIHLQADAGMVLCDGTTRTSIGGQVIAPAGSDVSAWVEMSPEAADKLIAENEAKRQAEEEAEQEGTGDV